MLDESWIGGNVHVAKDTAFPVLGQTSVIRVGFGSTSWIDADVLSEAFVQAQYAHAKLPRPHPFDEILTNLKSNSPNVTDTS